MSARSPGQIICGPQFKKLFRSPVFADLESALRVEKIFRAYILSRINMRPFAFIFSKKIFAAFFSYSAKFLPANRFCCAFIS